MELTYLEQYLPVFVLELLALCDDLDDRLLP